jgi:hypothetical protein
MPSIDSTSEYLHDFLQALLAHFPRMIFLDARKKTFDTKFRVLGLYLHMGKCQNELSGAW